MSNNAKNHETLILRLFDNFLKIWFSAQKSGSRLRCRTMLKIPYNTQKAPTKHVFELFDKFLKIRFSAKKFGSRLRFRTMLKYLETLRKHQLNMFWGLLRTFWKSGSGSKIRFSAQMSNNAKIAWNTQITPTKHVFRLFKNFLDIWFSAQKSGSRHRFEQC